MYYFKIRNSKLKISVLFKNLGETMNMNAFFIEIEFLLVLSLFPHKSIEKVSVKDFPLNSTDFLPTVFTAARNHFFNHQQNPSIVS